MRPIWHFGQRGRSIARNDGSARACESSIGCTRRLYRIKSTINVRATGTSPSPMTPILNARSSLIGPITLCPDQWAAQCSLCHGSNSGGVDRYACTWSRERQPRKPHRENTQSASGMVNTLERRSASATIFVHSQTLNAQISDWPDARHLQCQAGFRPPLLGQASPAQIDPGFYGEKTRLPK